MLERCPNCVGTGKLMGGGMIFVACHHCEGSGKRESVYNVSSKVDKESKVVEIATIKPKRKYVRKVKEG